METPNEVLITGERHLIIHGQLGNVHAKISQLEHLIRVSETLELLPYLAELELEVAYLVRYYPALDGGFDPVVARAVDVAGSAGRPEPNCFQMKQRIKNSLKDMRLLMDAANLSFVHEGAIDCHLKVMLDEAWQKAADIVDIGGIDDIPF